VTARTALVALCLAALSCVVYLPGLPGEFVYDDHRLIVENDGFKRPFEASRAFLRDYYASDVDRLGLGYYRPLTILSEEIDYRRGGGRPSAFHATNIALHAGCSLLVLALALRLTGGLLPAAALGAAFFAAHASHAESVAFVSGRVDPLATLFSLAAVILHLRANRSARPLPLRLAAGGAWLAGLLSKEMAITVPALVLLLETAEEGRPARGGRLARAMRYLPYAGALAVYLTMRVIALGQLWAPTGAAARSLVQPLVVLGSYLAWLVVPPPGLHLEPSPVGGLLAAGAVVVTTSALVLTWWLARRGRPLEAALVAGTVLTLLPVAQLKPLETVLSERFLYLPSAVVATLAAMLLARSRGLGRARWLPAALALSVLTLAHGTVLVRRAAVWRDEVTLWEAKEREEGGSLKARLNLAHAHARRGEPDEALVWYTRVKEIAPQLAPGIDAEIGTLEEGRTGSASTEEALRRALAEMPQDAALWNNLGFHLYKKRDVEGATRAFSRAVELTPGRPDPWIGLALTRLLAGDTRGAADAAGRARTIDPELALAGAILAECALREGRPCDALRLTEGLVGADASDRERVERLRSIARERCPEGT
jgi:protein O-mannosyl-transferase